MLEPGSDVVPHLTFWGPFRKSTSAVHASGRKIQNRQRSREDAPFSASNCSQILSYNSGRVGPRDFTQSLSQVGSRTGAPV
jgi:hypothetical protein